MPKQLPEFSSQDLQRNTSAVQDAALKTPIVITHRRRRRLVMLAIEEFERLELLAQSPKVFRLHELGTDILEQIAKSEMDQNMRTSIN